LFKSFGALCQIINRKNNKSNAATITLQMTRNRFDEFCVVTIAGPTATLSTCVLSEKRSVTAMMAIKANAIVRKKKPEV